MLDKIVEEGVLLKRSTQTRKIVVPEYIAQLDLVTARARMDLRTNIATKQIMAFHIKRLTEQEDRDITDRKVNNSNKRKKARMDGRTTLGGSRIVYKNVSAESEKIADDEGSSEQNHENLVELAPASSTEVYGEEPSQAGNEIYTVNSLDEFFGRPTRIYDATWEAGTTTNYNVGLDVWSLWVNDPTIRAKLSNYAYFRGDLCIKISVSGTAFHYGKIFVSYFPFPTVNSTLVSYDDLMGGAYDGSDDLRPLYLNYISQAPGFKVIDVNENEPLELRIPYTFPKEAMRLYNSASTVITNATDLDDFAIAGELRLATVNPIKIANEDFGANVSLNVYAWVENIELSVTTGTNINITAEAKKKRHYKKMGGNYSSSHGKGRSKRKPSSEQNRRTNWKSKMANKPIYDSSKSVSSRISGQMANVGEYTEPGPVSTIATAVSTIGETLSDIPVIGKFAAATSSVAKTVGKVASWFGFSKPAILEKPAFYKAIPWTNPVALSGPETTWKLSCDPKQELSIDQTLGGAGGDDCMAIKHITSRESYLATFEWANSDAAMDANLFQTVVSPIVFDYVDQTNGKEIVQPTALMFAAMPFTYWRGTIKYRFEIVTSHFHKGKLLFKYEPNFNQHALIAADDTKLNQQNTVIVDLQECTDLVLEVGWTNDRNFCRIANSSTFSNPIDSVDTVNRPFSRTGIAANTNIGFIQVRPVNELVQPTDLATVTINVYVSSDDMEFAVPTSTHINQISRRYTSAESEVLSPDSDSLTINQVETDHSNVFLQHFGEKVESFRALLKRYTFENGVGDSEISAGVFNISLTHPLYPSSHLYPGSSTSLEPSIKSYHLYDYLRYAYMANRGGFRYRIHTYGDFNHSTGSLHNVQLITDDSSNPTDISSLTSATTTSASVGSFFGKLDGNIRFLETVNGGVEFEVPYYSLNIYDFCSDPEFGFVDLAGNVLDGRRTMWEYRLYSKSGQNSADSDVCVGVDAATAEDFTFLRFQGAPLFVIE